MTGDDGFDWDELGDRELKRESRLERKLASQRDRSRFKKTDQKKEPDPDELHPNIKKGKEEFLRGRVLSVSSEGYEVDADGQAYICYLRGLLKKDRTLAKNLVTVGDWVLFEPLGEDEGQIAHVEERYSVLSRADNLSRRREQILAANIDQVLITASVMIPSIKPSLIDRYIIAAKKGNMRPVVLVNKVDLLDDSPVGMVEGEILEVLEEAYEKIGVTLIRVSADQGEGMEALRQLMQGQASVFSGQSGVGKTSLINAVTGQEFRVGETVSKTQKGSHTTTSPRLIPLEFGGWCIDTPGIKSFGIWNIAPEEVKNYYPEILKAGERCRFPNCTHRVEPGCAFLAAVEEGEVSPIRYESYLGLMDSLSQEHKRR